MLKVYQLAVIFILVISSLATAASATGSVTAIRTRLSGAIPRAEYFGFKLSTGQHFCFRADGGDNNMEFVKQWLAVILSVYTSGNELTVEYDSANGQSLGDSDGNNQLYCPIVKGMFGKGW